MQQLNIEIFDYQRFPPFLESGGTPFAHGNREILSFSFYSTFHRGSWAVWFIRKRKETPTTIIHRARGRYTRQLYTSNCCKFPCIHHGFLELLTFYINVETMMERWWTLALRQKRCVRVHACKIAHFVCASVHIGTCERFGVTIAHVRSLILTSKY